MYKTAVTSEVKY